MKDNLLVFFPRPFWVYPHGDLGGFNCWPHAQNAWCIWVSCFCCKQEELLSLSRCIFTLTVKVYTFFAAEAEVTSSTSSAQFGCFLFLRTRSRPGFFHGFLVFFPLKLRLSMKMAEVYDAAGWCVQSDQNHQPLWGHLRRDGFYPTWATRMGSGRWVGRLGKTGGPGTHGLKSCVDSHGQASWWVGVEHTWHWFVCFIKLQKDKGLVQRYPKMWKTL